MNYMCPEYLSYIYGFLELCPCPLLEKLFARLPDNTDDSYAIGDTIERPPDVHFNRLGVIKMHHFRGTKCEMMLVSFLLEKPPALESLVLVAPPKPSTGEGIVGDEQGGPPPGLKFMEEMDMRIVQGQVLAPPRVSGAVQIVVCEYLEDRHQT